MTTEPLISVVIPCRNEEARIRGCLDALARQDFPRDRYEVLIVDGASTDGSADVARDMGVRVIDDHGEGPAGARNVGIAASTGRIVAFTDSDCAPRADWLTRVAEVFAEDPGIAGVAGSLRMARRGLLGRLEDLEAQAYYRGFITSNVSYRREALLAVGGFDATLQCAEDYDLAWRVMDAGYRIVHDPRPVCVHDPPEIAGDFGTYLRKQFWYGKSDVVANARAMQRARSRPDAPGSALALQGSATAALDAALAAAMLAAPLSPRLAIAALAASAAAATKRLSDAAWRYGHPRDELGVMAAIVVARRLSRGLGTLSGCASLAAQPAREVISEPALRAFARAPLPPSPAPAGPMPQASR